MDNKTINSVIT